MDKEHIFNNRIMFIINNKNDFEYIQNHLYCLGFEWLSECQNLLKAFNNYPFYIYTIYGCDKKKEKNEYYITYTYYKYIKNNSYKIVKVCNFLRKEKLQNLKF